MMKKKLLLLLTALAAAALLFSGCSASISSNDKVELSPGFPENGAAGGMDGSLGMGETVKPDSTTGEFERKVIRTVTMSCESKVYDDAVTVIMTVLGAHGGYVEASSSTGNASKSTESGASVSQTVHTARYATFTLRVPAEQLDAFLEALRTDGNIHITTQSMTSSEITGVYYDTQTRLETLTAEKDALSAMLAGFTDYSNISAMLQVRDRLYDVIEEMEALQTKLNLYDSQVAMSTVNLTLREVIEYTPTEIPEPTFGERIGEAFASSWKNFAYGCQNVAVWFVEAFPTLLILGVIAVIVSVVILRFRKKKKSRKGE